MENIELKMMFEHPKYHVGLMRKLQIHDILVACRCHAAVYSIRSVILA